MKEPISKKKQRICCLLSGILGNHTVSNKMLASLGSSGITPDLTIWLNGDDYRLYPANRVQRLSSELETESVFRQKLKASSLEEYDLYLVNSPILALATSGMMPYEKLIVATDATPAIAEGLHRRLGRRNSVPRVIMHSLREQRFKQLATAVGHWLPMSNTCAKSLIEDYGVDPLRCSVTYAPQTVSKFLPERAVIDDPLKLLFVSNLFRLKGGPALCSAVREFKNAELTIVSNDPEALPYDDSHQIRVIAGIKDPVQIQVLYREAHLLVHPTSFDHYPNVILEGLAQGLPFITTDGFGPGELIELSGAGWPIAWPPHERNIADAIRNSVADQERHRQRSERAILFAQTNLTPERFSGVIASALKTTASAIS